MNYSILFRRRPWVLADSGHSEYGAEYGATGLETGNSWYFFFKSVGKLVSTVKVLKIQNRVKCIPNHSSSEGVGIGWVEGYPDNIILISA